MGNFFQNDPGNMQKPHFKVLVIGMSGSGKTTTINMLVNQAMSIEYRQERKIAIKQIVELYQNGQIAPYILENNIKEYSALQSDQLKQSSESQTQRCNIYEINKEGYDISFIDTPGVGDSGGKEADKRNQATILEFVRQHLDISCILYVHRSTDARKSFNMSHYNNPLNNILPDQIRNNCIVCFTNVMSTEKIPAIQVLKEQGIPLDRKIFLENDCLIPFNLMPFTNQEEREFYLNKSEIFWQRNKQQYNSLIAYLQQMQQQRQIQSGANSKGLDLSFKTQALMKMIHICISESEKLHREYLLMYASLENKKNQLRAISDGISSMNTYGSSPALAVNQVQRFLQTRQSTKLNAPVMFCYICSKICHQKCTVEELAQNGSVNIRKCKIFCEGKYEECTSCSHYSAYHSHTNDIQEDLTVPFGQNLNRMETLQSLKNSIQKDDLQLKSINGDLETALSTVVELEMKLEEDASIRNFKSDFMKEYLQYSTIKAQNDKALTQQQYDERIKELNYLNKVYQIKKSQAGSQPSLPLGQKEILNSKIQLEIKRLKEQYSSS